MRVSSRGRMPLNHKCGAASMPDSTPGEPILEVLRRSGGSAITLENAAWLVWPPERRSGVSAAMSQAQFVHFNAPVVAVQTGGRMEYFDSEGNLGWASNLAWPRANLEMARLLGRPEVLEETSPTEAHDDNSTSTDEPNDWRRPTPPRAEKVGAARVVAQTAALRVSPALELGGVRPLRPRRRGVFRTTPPRASGSDEGIWDICGKLIQGGQQGVQVTSLPAREGSKEQVQMRKAHLGQAEAGFSKASRYVVSRTQSTSLV